MVESWANRFYASADEAWRGLYEGLSIDGEIVAPRGERVKETLGCNIYIAHPENNLVMSPFRGLSPIYMAKEYAWYNEGSRDPKVAPNSKFWESISNDDGLINSNYGHWLFATKDNKSKELTAFDATVQMLKDDPDTRHAIIQIPIMPFRRHKDTPCTSHIHFFIRGGQLLANVYMRSCDVCCGFPYDIFQFTMWQLRLAHELELECGWLRFMAGSLHCYEEDWYENRVKDADDFSKDLTTSFTGMKHLPRMSKEFQEDLKNLAICGKNIDVKSLNSDELKVMMNNRKIWTREAW